MSSGTGAVSTRRGFIGGAAAAGAAQVVAGSLLSAEATAAVQKPCALQPEGIPTGPIAVTPDGRTVWTTDTHGTTITAHRGLKRGRSIDVGGAPVDIALSPRGTHALVTTAFYDEPGLVLVDLRSSQIRRFDVGEDPHGVAFAADGRMAYVSGGGAAGALWRLDLGPVRLRRVATLGANPRGVAVTPDGKRVLVALNGASGVALVTLGRKKTVRRMTTSMYPDQVAVSPDGKRAYVTHNGFRSRLVTPVDLVKRRARKPLRVGVDPAGLAFTRSGKAVVVASSSGTVALLDGKTGRRRRTVKSAGTPRSVAVAGARAIVADGYTGKLSSFRLGSLR